MCKWLRNLVKRPFRRRREEQWLLETDPGLATATAVPCEVKTQGCGWAAGGSDRGRSRPNNEDALLCACERHLFIVCDGMGGHAAGEVASREAIKALDEVLAAERLAQALGEGEESTKGFLREALQQANDRVVALGQENPSWSGMASTAVIAVLNGNRLHVSNLGDSRAYAVPGPHRLEACPEPFGFAQGKLRRRDGAPTSGDDIRLLTTDHSVAAALMQQGRLTREQARLHPLRNHLTASLGVPQAVAPAYASVEVNSGDRIVLCSDGLWDMLTDAEIAQMATAYRDPHEAVKALISAANAAGGLDNITVIVVIVGAEEAIAEGQAAMETITGSNRAGAGRG